VTRKQILTFIAMGIGVSVITVDIAAINVALPAVEKSFKTTVGTIEWVINGYALSFGVLMVTCGRLADTFGRRKIFFIGTVAIIIFGFGSNYYGLVPGLVIVGIGLGFTVPSITTAAVGAVKESRASLAGGIVYMFQLVGGALGLAVATTIFTDFAKNDLLIRLSGAGISVSQTERSEIISFLLGSGSKQVLSDSLGQEKFVEIFTHIHHAYITGVDTGLAFAASFVAVGALLALFFVKGKVSQNNIG